VDVWIDISLTSALVGAEWLASRPGRFTPWERGPWYRFHRRLVEHRGGLDVVENGKCLTLPGLELRTLSFSRSTDRASPTSRQMLQREYVTLTRACHRLLSWARQILRTSAPSSSLECILILSHYLNVLCHAHHTKQSPCGGGLEYLHRSPASRKRRRKGSPMTGGIPRPPCSWGI
jgi:hypothetical protein